MEKFFKLSYYGTNVRTEFVAGFATFFTMAYIIFVNPNILTLAGTPDNPFNPQGIFVATILSTVVGTLVMALFANVPYALAPGMGMNAFFTFTVCQIMGFTWEQALAMVLICGVINIVITTTGLRKAIIRSLPKALQSAIGGGIGLFIAYIGIKDTGLLKFTSDPGTYLFLGKTPADATVIANSSAVPALVNFSNPAVFTWHLRRPPDHCPDGKEGQGRHSHRYPLIDGARNTCYGLRRESPCVFPVPAWRCEHSGRFLRLPFHIGLLHRLFDRFREGYGV